jgi:signal transduction histidine kinase
MLDFNTVTFLIFGTLVLGLSIIAYRDVRQQGQMHLYWFVSLALFGVAYFLFAFAPLIDMAFQRVADFCLISASLVQALLFRSWHQPIARRLEALVVVLALITTGVYGWLIRHGTHQHVVGLIMGALILISFWRLYELVRADRREPHFTLKFIMLFVLAYIVLCVSRFVVTVFGMDDSLYTEGMGPFVTRSLGSTFTVLTHIAIHGYFTERYWRGQQQVLQQRLDALQLIHQLESKVESTQASNETLKQLIQQRDHMLMINSRFSTVSSLAMFNSAIVHELSQPLTALMLTLEEAKWHLKDADPAKIAPIERSMTLVQKIGQMNQSLRNLMMAQKPDYEPVDLTACIQDMLPILQNESHRRSVHLTACIEPPELVVHAHKVMFERIIFNLVANAMDALTAPSEQPDQPQITLQLAQQMHRDRPHAVLTVSDNGPGFESHLLAQEWLHFQSTKATGMGVGLILCHYILSTWNGDMTIENLSTGGASVQLWIPLKAA